MSAKSSTNSKILTNLHHDRFIFERRRPFLKQCIMGSDDVNNFKMAKSISAWEERVIFYVFLNIHANVTRFIIVSNESLYKDYSLPRIKFHSKILNEFVRDEIDLDEVLRTYLHKLYAWDNKYLLILVRSYYFISLIQVHIFVIICELTFIIATDHKY